jgi:hypothetical protein
MPYIATRRLYLAADGQTVVEEGDPRAATLLVGVGGQLSDADAARYGLLTSPDPEPGEKARPAPANKLRKAPAENK